MGLFGRGRDAQEEQRQAQAQYRKEAWSYALENDELPEFVEDRLKAAAAGKTPWLSTTTPAELLLGRSHGLRPLATVSGTCWLHYGWSWTEGHVDGWDSAIARIKSEALAVGANAVVDVQMRTSPSPSSDSMDFTLFGTAIRFDKLPASSDPAIATVSALDFVRLLEMGIAVCGIAVGADYDYLNGSFGGYAGGYGGGYGTALSGPSDFVASQLRAFGGNANVEILSDLWQRIRRNAHGRMRDRAALTGNGVLARTHFGQLLRVERDKQSPDYLGRQIVIGTVVDTVRASTIPHNIQMVVDMRDGLSPLLAGEDRAVALDDNHDFKGGI